MKFFQWRPNFGSTGIRCWKVNQMQFNTKERENYDALDQKNLPLLYVWPSIGSAYSRNKQG